MEIIEALQVVISNTKATEQAIVNSQNAIITAIHATAQSTAGTQAGVAVGGNNPLAGYTTSTAGHVPGSGAPQPVGYPPPGGASTGYSAPPPGGGPPSGGGAAAPAPQPGRSPQPGYNQPVPPGGQQNAAGPGLYNRLKQSLGGGALTTGRFNGIMGLISEAYKPIVNEAENAARYQGMEGGTTRVHGVQERGEEVAYGVRERLRHGLSGMTVAEAQQAFADVTSFGYRDTPIQGAGGSRDPNRREVLDFMARNKVNMGMSEGESFQVVNAMVGNTRTSLVDLSDALHQVSDAAEHAGVNALVARQNFLTMFTNLTQAGAGQGAARLAAGAQASLAGYGRDMQNIDTSVQFSTSWQYRAAANAGMAVGTYQNMMRTNPGRVQRILDQVTTRGIENTIGTPAVNWIRQRAKQAPYAGNIQGNPELLQNLADEYENRFQPNLDQLVQVVRASTGVTVDQGQVTRWVVGHILGMNASAQMKNQPQAANHGHEIQPGQGTAGVTGLAASGSGNTGQEATRAGGKALDAGQQAYYDVAQGRGKGYRDPIIEAVLGKVKDRNAQVIVSVDGEHRQVSLSDAIRYYHEEIAKGDVIFADGKNKGQSVAKVAGVESDESRQTGGELTQTGKGRKVGTKISESQYNDALNANPDIKNGPDTTGQMTMVGLTDEAKKLLKLVPNAPASAADAASGARPNPSGATNEGVRGITVPGLRNP